MSDQWTITTGAELRQRIRSGEHLEHSRENGYFLRFSLERVSPLAVAEERLRVDRMRDDLQKQQQQTRDYVGRMVERLEEVEREKPKQREEGRER